MLLDLPKSKSALKRLSICFYMTLISIILLIALPVAGAEVKSLSMVLAALYLVGYLAFLFFLGTLAAELGKSPIVWVGLTIITSPIGWLVAYPLIKGQVPSR